MEKSYCSLIKNTTSTALSGCDTKGRPSVLVFRRKLWFPCIRILAAPATSPLLYIFYVGGWEARKNIPFLVRAFAQSHLTDVKLVLAGGKYDERDSLIDLIDSLQINHQIQLLGWVDEEDLPALYAEAVAFVYPSEYEGFGLQLCEAMAVGCPILAANATCLPEVLADGGKLFSLDKTSTELVDLLKSLDKDRSYRDELGKKAKQRSQKFDWHHTAIETMAIYHKQLGC